MDERELTIDDLSSAYDDGMENEMQPTVSYFAEGGEVEDSAAILSRIPQRPMPTPMTPPAPRRTAAQMLQTFADGGEVQKTPFPELLDINKQINAGAPVENLFGANLSQPTTAMASTPSQINIPTFQSTYTPPTGPNIITPTPAIAAIGAQPTLSQPVSAPTTTARSLFEQLNPSTMAAMPDYSKAAPTYTATAQTFEKPTLLTKEQLQKAQPTLVRYEPDIKYGGLETYKGPLQTSPYMDLPGAPGADGAAPAPAAPPPNITPGGYRYTTYASLTPDQLAGLGNKAQLGETFTAIVKRQQADVSSIRAEFNNAVAGGDMEAAMALRPLLVQKEADLRQAIADQGMASKYFTGISGAFETPEQYRQRLLTTRLSGSRLGPELTSMSLEGLQYKAPEKPVKGGPTPFAAQINTQKGEYEAALAVYNQLSAVYGKNMPFVQNYFEQVVAPQKAEYDSLIAKPVMAAASSADRLLADPALARVYAPPRISPTSTVSGTTNAFKPIVSNLELSIKTLNNARSAAEAAGLTGYASQLGEAITLQQDKLNKALEDRQAAVDSSLPDPVRKRAMGSPLEGEVADSRSRALLKKLSGDSDAATVPVQQYGKGGLVRRAEGSPVYGEIAIGEGGITKDTLAGLKSKKGTGSALSDSARLLRNVMGEGVSNLESAVRGSVAAIPGSVGDIESIFRESDKTRKFATTEEVLRDYMPKRMTKATKEGKGFEEVGSYLPLPIPAGTVSKTAKGVKTGARKALEELGPIAAQKLERLDAKLGVGPMYVVKPTGGNFMPAGFDSKLDQYLEIVVQVFSKAEGLAGKDAKAVADFIRTKGRKYFTTDFGTSNDPFRAALSEGRLGVYGKDKNLFRDYLLDAAREGRPTAIEDLERAYDDATKLQGIVYNKPEGRGFTTSGRVETELRQKLEEAGVLPEHINPGGLYPYSSQEMAQTSFSPARKKLGELLKSMEELPPELQADFIRGVGKTDPGAQSILYAATKEQPIYDLSQTPAMDFLRPENVAEDIASVVSAGSLKDLERMTFSDAVIRGAQNMRLKRDWQTVIQTAKEGKRVPKEIYFKGTESATGTGIPLRVGENLQWVRIMTPDAVELEGAAMRHSVGDYKYKDVYNLGGKEGFKSERARVYSLRNDKGVPQVTVEMEALPDGGGLRVTRQIQGKFNSEPNEEQKRAIFQLFDELNPQSIESAKYSSTRTGDRLENDTNVNWGDLYNQYKSYKEGTQGFAGGGIVRKAAQALTKMGAKESQVAGKELTTLQDTYTSFGDSVRDRAAKMRQQMDEMEFKYKPGQRVFTEDSAKKNKAPYTIKSKRLSGDMIVRDPKTLKAVRDPETGKAKRTPYEPGYLIREENGPDDWAEYVLPESAIKGSVDEFAKGGRVGKKLPGKRKYI